MSVPPTFPTLSGQGWSVFRRPKTSTRIVPHVSGREVRSPNYVYPLYGFEVNFDGLQHAGAFPNLGEVDALQAFILSLAGPLLPFLYVDPQANATTGSVIGTGDGKTTTFSMLRRVGRTFGEPVGWVTAVSSVEVFAAGSYADFGFAQNDPVTSSADYGEVVGDPVATTLDYGNVETPADTTPPYTLINGAWPAQIAFATAPAAGSTIVASFTYAFLCRFDEDVQEFENIMSGLWQMQSLKFSTFR